MRGKGIDSQPFLLRLSICLYVCLIVHFICEQGYGDQFDRVFFAPFLSLPICLLHFRAFVCPSLSICPFHFHAFVCPNLLMCLLYFCAFVLSQSVCFCFFLFFCFCFCFCFFFAESLCIKLTNWFTIRCQSRSSSVISISLVHDHNLSVCLSMSVCFSIPQSLLFFIGCFFSTTSFIW